MIERMCCLLKGSSGRANSWEFNPTYENDWEYDNFKGEDIGFRCVYLVNSTRLKDKQRSVGGSWYTSPQFLLQAHHYFANYQENIHSYQGFRCIYPTMEK